MSCAISPQLPALSPTCYSPGADHSPRGRLGPYPDSAARLLAEPYRRCVPYLGRVGTEGTALFLAVCAATTTATKEYDRTAATMEHSDWTAIASSARHDQSATAAAVDLVAALLAAGADPNGGGGGSRPGSRARCGMNISPLALALVALEEAAGDDDKTAGGGNEG